MLRREVRIEPVAAVRDTTPGIEAENGSLSGTAAIDAPSVRHIRPTVFGGL